MSEGTTVWAVLLSWDGAEETLACLRSLAAQTRRPDRVLVIDNGSREPLEAPALDRAYPGVRLLREPENIGYAAGIYRGLGEALDAGADHVLTPNNDTVLDPECLEQLLAALRAEPRAAAVSPKVWFEGEPARIYFSGGGYSPVLLKPRHDHWERPDPGPEVREAYATGFLNACCALYRSAALREVGGFDETYFAYYEDADLSRRLERSGWTLWIAPRAQVRHADALSFVKHAPAGSGRTPPQKWFLVTRNQAWFLRRYGTWAQRAAGLAYLAVSRAVIAALLFVRGHRAKASAVLRGVREGLGPLPAARIPHWPSPGRAR